MNKDYIFKFFGDIQTLKSELERYIEQDIKIKIDSTILRMHKALDHLKKGLDNSYREMFGTKEL